MEKPAITEVALCNLQNISHNVQVLGNFHFHGYEALVIIIGFSLLRWIQVS